MKIFLLLLGLLFTSAAAQTKSEARFVDAIVAEAIEDLSQRIQDNGMDPFHFTDAVEHRLPVTDLFVLKAHVEDLVLVGLSKIIVNRISFNIITSRLTFDLSLPSLFAEVASSSFDLSVFGFKSDVKLSGSLNIENTRVTGEARITAGVITGISLRSLSIDFTVQAIKSNLRLAVAGTDYTRDVNQMVGTTVPKVLEDNRKDINTVIEFYVRQAVEDFL